MRKLLAAARSEQGFRSTQERLVLALLVAVPMLATAIALLPEVTIPVASVNDDMLHYLFITNASDALANGGNLFDHWLSQIELGVPQFLYYQHLPHLVVIGIQRLLLGSVDLLTVFNVVRFVLLVTFPLTVYWSMRRMGFSQVAAAISAAVASLLSGGQLYGFEYDSYVWRGWGMYTQLWAMHLSFITLASVYRALTTGRGMAIAVIALAALVLSHLIYAYMMAITILVVLVIGMNRANAGTRIARLGVIGAPAALISSYMWLPFIQSIAYDNATPYLQSYKYDSFGAGQIVGWLVSGRLFDDGRLPVLTILLAVGIIAALVARRRAGVLALALFGIWLVLYFGRPSVAFLVDLLPLHDSLLLHRFIGSVDLAAIILMGIGGAALWALIAGPGIGMRLVVAGAAGVFFLLPAISERLGWYEYNTAWMARSQVAMAADTDGASIIATLKALPPGRVFAGLPGTWGSQLHDADVPFYDLLPFHGIEGVPPPNESMSLNADYLWDFNDHNLAQYDLFNIRYVVAPSGLAMADFLKPLQRAGVYTLYEAPTSGYAEYVNIVSWEPVANQRALYTRNRPWVNGNGPAGRNYVAYDFPTTSVVPSGMPAPGCPGGGQILRQDAGTNRFGFVVDCPVDSPLVIKATYHPNWDVQVDGQPVRTFMMSPSYIGIQLPAGKHTVTALYRATPMKTPLLLLGGLALLFTLLLGRRLNPVAEWLGSRLRLPARLGSRLRLPAGPPRLAATASGQDGIPPPADEPTVPPAAGARPTAETPPAPNVAPAAWEPWALRLEGLVRRHFLGVVGFATVGLYLVVWLAQRAIFTEASVVSPAPAPSSRAVSDVVAYYVATGGVFALYGALLVWLRDRPLDRGALRIAFLVPAVVAVLFLLDRAHFSVDVYSYIGHGSIALGDPANATTVLPASILSTPIGQILYAHGWRPAPLPSPYGPIWTILERIVTVGADDVDRAAFAFKLGATAAFAGSAWLVWQIVGRIQPSRRQLAAIAFLWNPMLLIELAGEGHNDGVTILLALLAIWFSVRARPAAGAAATVVGALIKYVPLILLPFQAVIAWRQGGRPAALRMAAGLVVGGLASAVAFWVVGFSPASLDSLLRSVGQGVGWPSLSSSWSGLLGDRLGSPAAALVRVGLPAVFAAYVLWEAWRSRTVVDALRALGFVAVIYLFGVSPAFLPWYAILPVALLVLVPDDESLALAFALSLVARVIAPLVDLRPDATPFPWLTLDLIVPISAVLLGWTVWLRASYGRGSDADGPATGPRPGGDAGPPAAGHPADAPREPDLARTPTPGADRQEATVTGAASATGDVAVPRGNGTPNRPQADLRQTRGLRLFVLLGAVSLLAALLADRFSWFGGPWLWNFDTPIWDYPLASFFHEALSHGQLPLWNDNLGLGFPLYAEGQIGALYPPNWLIFQLPPLLALDAARVVHLTFLGMGTGLLALRVSGSRLGAVMAAGAIVLSGGIVSKLEWTNVIEAFAWLPWVLLPLVRRPVPTRAGLVAAGVLWGVMALAGHPNVWMLTGLTAGVLLLSIRPRVDTLVRLVALGGIAAAVGAVQVLPTAILWSLSTRSAGLAANDLFGATAMPFDMLGAAFANVFVKYQLPAQELWSTWYPGGGWSPPEIGVYLGLPLLALAATSVRLRRARPLVAVAAFMIAFPIIGGLRPEIWAALPVWNAMHAPVKGYMVLDLMVVLLGAIAIGRLKHGHIRWRAAGWVVVAFAAAYAVLGAIVFVTPDLFRDLVRRYWHWPPPDQADVVWRQARDALSQLSPVAFELALGVAAVWLLWSALTRRRAAWLLVALVLLPLALLSPPVNQVLGESAFDYSGTPLIRGLAASRPTRVMAVNHPLYWSGMPDQLAAAGIPTLEMFSSLNLLAPTRTFSAAAAGAPVYALARAIGVDTLVTVNAPCPGSVIVAVPAENAVACRLLGALRPPYWLPADAVQVAPDSRRSPIRPVTATFAPEDALAKARPVSVIEWTNESGQLAVDAPSAGWVFTGRAWWPGWTTTIDGTPAVPDQAYGAQLIFVTPGVHVIRQSLDLWDVRLGLLIGLLTLLAAVAWARWGLPTASRACAARGDRAPMSGGPVLAQEPRPAHGAPGTRAMPDAPAHGEPHD